MASVNFLKLHGINEVAAQLRHSLTEERLKHRHSNPDIDLSLTSKNKQWGGDYHSILDLYRFRILELDATTNKNHRKDRVTAYALETTVPAGLTVWQEDAWCADFVNHLRERFGNNFLCAAQHCDEVHVYSDKDGTLKRSRTHIHAYVIPEVDGHLNGRTFSSRAEMIRLNHEIDDLTRDRYSVPYMTGDTPHHQSVERLKVASAKRERQRAEEEIKKLREDYKRLAEEYNKLIDEQNELYYENETIAACILERKKDKKRGKCDRDDL